MNFLILAAYTAWGGVAGSHAQTFTYDDRDYVAELLVFNGMDKAPVNPLIRTMEIEGYGRVTFEVDTTPNRLKDPRDLVTLIDWPSGLRPSVTSVWIPEQQQFSIQFFPLILG